MGKTKSFNWHAVPVEYRYRHNAFPALRRRFGVAFDRIEIRCSEPLPIEPVFVTPHSGLLQREGSEAYLRAVLDREYRPSTLPLFDV